MGIAKFPVCYVANWIIKSEVLCNLQISLTPLIFSAQDKISYPFCDLSLSRFVLSHSKERNTFQLQCTYYKVESSPIWERDERLGETENVVQDPISLLPVSGDLTEEEVGGKRGRG